MQPSAGRHTFPPNRRLAQLRLWGYYKRRQYNINVTVKVTSVNSSSGLDTIFWVIDTRVRFPYLLSCNTFTNFLDV